MPGLTGNRRMRPFDKALELYDYATAAVAATTIGTALSLAATKLESYKAVVFYDTLTGVDSSNFWTVTVQASADNSTWKTVGTIQLAATKTTYDVPLSGEFVDENVPSAVYLRSVLTKTGTAGNLKAGVFLTLSC
jgi:hypothetical protein